MDDDEGTEAETVVDEDDVTVPAVSPLLALEAWQAKRSEKLQRVTVVQKILLLVFLISSEHPAPVPETYLQDHLCRGIAGRLNTEARVS